METRKSVVTGDIISSSKLSNEQLSEIRTTLKREADLLEGVVLPLEFFRGDGFQLACSEGFGFRNALILKMVAKGLGADFDIRVSIGVGNTDIHTSTVRESDGEPFTISGRNLDAMKEMDRTLVLGSGGYQSTILPVLVQLFDDFIRDIKPGQAKVLALALKGKSQKEISQYLAISQPAVSKVLQSVRYRSIQSVLKVVESYG